ncbi:hypothetical protein, partial [Serratia marcescens]
ETPGIFIVLSGFATTDLSVRFCDACQGGEAYEKTATPHPFSWLFLIPAPPLYLVIREPVTPAAVSRQERSDRVREEASFHPYLHIALTPHSHIFLLPHEALS